MIPDCPRSEKLAAQNIGCGRVISHLKKGVGGGRSILIRFVDFWRIAAGFKLSMAVYTANIEETKKP